MTERHSPDLIPEDEAGAALLADLSANGVRLFPCLPPYARRKANATAEIGIALAHDQRLFRIQWSR